MYKITNTSARSLGFPKLRNVPAGGFVVVSNKVAETFQKIKVVKAWIAAGDCTFTEADDPAIEPAPPGEQEVDQPDEDLVDLEGDE